jgi:DNA ligase-1
MTSTSFSPGRRRALAYAAGLALAPTAAGARARPHPSAPAEEPALATVYVGQVDPALCLVSEKYDGVRAIWDGRLLRHRSGRPVSAPASFVSTLPAVPLDGELWLGRGRFDALSAIVRRSEPRDDEWSGVRYMAFEMPGAAGTFAERVDLVAAAVTRSRPRQLECAPQRRLAHRVELDRALAEVVAGGGEGLMLHVASAPYVGGRSDALMKLKPHLDAEAVVVGYRPGAGRNRSLVGALEVESGDGRRFLVGSGLTDELRRSPPEIGSVITYRHRDLTSTGLPRFATYLRRHETF